MNWTELSKHAQKLAVALVVTVLASWILHDRTSLHTVTAAETEGLNTLILLIGSIFAVMYAFVIFVIWGQFTEVENLVVRECSSLNDLLRFHKYLNPDASQAIRRAVGEYAQRVVDSEWGCLSISRKDPLTERAFVTLVNAIMRVTATNANDAAVLSRLVDIVRKTAEHRDERVAKSLTRIPPTLLRLVQTIAAALVLLIFLYPFHHWLAGAAGAMILVVVLFFANLVMTDTDNPFQGVCNLSPQPFSDLIR
jgi:hypothetical protein